MMMMTMSIAAAANDDDDQDDVAQVWTGDFNALTREDYTDAGWARVAEVPLYKRHHDCHIFHQHNTDFSILTNSTQVRARGSWEKPQVLRST